MPLAIPGNITHTDAFFNDLVPNYQTPYSNSPYGPGIPTSTASPMNAPPNYAMGGGMPMGGFPVHQGMNPQQQQQQQQMMQRMHQGQPNAGGMPTPTPQRSFPNQPQGTPTPTHAQPSQQPQFPMPQNTHGTPQSLTPINGQPQPPQTQSSNNNIQTPQTPTFPTLAHGSLTNGGSSAPLSPGADLRDKERVGIILQINTELLFEAIQLQATQQAMAKERTSPTGSDGNANENEKKPTAEETLLGQDYVNCMRRLQSNLTYLAALADRKPNVTTPPYPAYMKAPPLNASVKLRQTQGPDGSENKPEFADREETAKYLQSLYKKLQDLFPGVDASKEPAYSIPGSRASGPGSNTSKTGSQTPSQASPVPGKQKTPKMGTSAPPTTSAPTPA
ncbi:hypothetical protein F4778DRAFT_214448 [Xylariomycetidae sp. FL2044]|nr:hypothetical protein F4778DRAFT_214448 [Xylariomycetidae sp. FL2044]